MSSNLKVNTILPSTGTTVTVSGISSVTSSISAGSSITATTFYGSGANLTSLPSQLTLSNNADNRVITGGSGTNLNGESGFTFDGSRASIINSAGPILELCNNTNTTTMALRLHEGTVGSTANGGGMTYDGSSNKLHITCGTNLTTKRITITRDGGLVGINTDSPSAAWLDIASDSGSYDHLRLRRISSDSNVASNWSLKPYGGNLYFRTGGSTDKIYFDDNGDLNIMDGNLIIATAGHGIDFSSTSDGSSVSNKSEILDDYEEGSFTPTMSVEGQGSNASLAVAIGNYTKVGSMVNIWIEVQFNGIPSGRSTGNAWQFGGLPFSSQQYNSSPSGLRDYRFPMIAMAVDTGGTYGSNGHFVFRLFDNNTIGRIEWQHSDLELKNASLFIKDGTMIQIHACYPDF